MYPDIQKELETGSVLLEWDYSKGEPPAPLLKEKFSNERKKAKIMEVTISTLAPKSSTNLKPHLHTKDKILEATRPPW